MNSSPPDRLNTPAVPEDLLEFEAFALTQNPLDMEAATWAVRRRNGLDANGAAELRAWLDMDPQHAAALDDMDAMLGEVQQLPDDAVDTLKAGLAQPAGAQVRQAPVAARPASPGRRQWLLGWGAIVPQAAAAATAFSVVGGGWMGWDYWQRQPTFEQAFSTERGQRRMVNLPDAKDAGSRLQLDTATRLEARLYRDRREVRLHDGQAMFTVQPDSDRPFHVWAGALRITVVGTRFSVRQTASGLDAGQTVISVEEGRVRLARAGADAALSPVELTAGQMVVADEAGRISPVTRVRAAVIAPWRDGRLSFDQTPLGQAIAEFERYGPTGLVVRDPAVAAWPVGGSYSVHQWQRFAATLPHVLPVRLEQRGDHTEIVAR
ncbi:MAG: FecR family protein [Polaromonas sp.]